MSFQTPQYDDDMASPPDGSSGPSAGPSGTPQMNMPQMNMEQMMEFMMQTIRAATAAAPSKKEKIDVQPFDGSDYSLYPQFESVLRAKFTLEAPSFPSESAKIWWALGKLKDKAARVMNPWTEAYQTDPEGFTIEKLFEQMKVQFGDTERQKKALERLQHLRQGNRSFEELLADFNRLLLEAGGHGWDDKLKIGMLRESLNWSMKDRMVAVLEADRYQEYCQQVKTIADKLEALNRGKKFSRYMNTPRTAGHPTNAAIPQTPQISPDVMEWEPTQSRIGTGERRRAKWVSAEELQRRREERRCLQCGGSGHYKTECPYLPARRPSGTPRPKPEARVAAIAPMLEDDDVTKPETEDSGKE